MRNRFIALFVVFILAFSLIRPFHIEATSSPWARPSIVRLELLGILEEGESFEASYKAKLVREEFSELLVKFYLFVEGGSVENYGSLSPFSDTENRYVIAAHKLGLVNGISESEFGPRKEITREQVATMMFRALTKMQLGAQAKSYQSFADDAKISPWAREAVYFCKANSIIQGMEGGNFAPKKSATKEELIKILDNTLLKFNKAGIKSPVLDRSFQGYKIPSKSMSTLDYSYSSEQKALRITIKEELQGSPDFDVVSAAYEIYEVTSPVIGHAKAELIALRLIGEWSKSNLSFSVNRYYGITSKSELLPLKDGGTYDVMMSFNGSFIIDVIR